MEQTKKEKKNKRLDEDYAATMEFLKSDDDVDQPVKSKATTVKTANPSTEKLPDSEFAKYGDSDVYAYGVSSMNPIIAIPTILYGIVPLSKDVYNYGAYFSKKITRSINSSPTAKAIAPKVESSVKLASKAIIAKSNNCRWDLSTKPRIVFGPGCNAKGSRICRGFVICDNQIRAVACSERLCTPETASECANQKNYTSTSIQ